MSMTNESRLFYVDCLRSFSILLMIMGHVGYTATFSRWICVFHMPIWFFLAGYMWRKRNSFRKYIKRKAFTLIVPFVVIGLLNVIWTFFETGNIRLISFIYPNSNEDQFSVAGALWFLPALFLSEVVAYKILEVKNGDVYCIIIGILGSLISNLQVILVNIYNCSFC